MKNLFIVLFLFTGFSASAQFKNNNQTIFNVKNYGAKGNGVEHYVASIPSNFTLTCTDCAFTSADVGKVIVVDSAKGSGKPLITTIAAFTNSTTVTLTATATASVTAQRVVYGTDDTQAIQDAINACYAAVGGTVWIPNGLYIINGALQTSIAGVNPNSQLYIPSPSDSRSPARAIITIEGETAPSWIGNDIFNNVTYFPSKKGTVLLSTIDGSGTAAAMIGSKGPSTSFNNFNYNHLEIKNLTLLTQINPNGSGPSVGGINALFMTTFYRSHVRVEVDGIIFNEPAPTNDVAGIITPGALCETMNTGEYNMVIGYRYGIVHGEHDQSQQEQTLACYWGHVISHNSAACYGGRWEAQWCTWDLAVPGRTILGITSDSAFFNVSQFETEDLTTYVTGKWYNNQGTISDSMNLGTGSVLYNLTQSGSSYSSNQNFLKLGGALINTKTIGNQFGGSVSGLTAGQVAIAASATTLTGVSTFTYSGGILTASGTGNDIIDITGTGASGNGFTLNHTVSSGQANLVMQNNRGSFASYADFIYGGSANAIGNLFGVSRADKLILFADGASNLGMAIGTLQSQPLIFGTNNTNRFQISGAGDFTFGIGKFGITEGSNGRAGQTTLVTGTKAITISGLTTSSRAIVTLVSQGGTVTTTIAYAAVCTSNTLTITALTTGGTTDTTDTSVLNYFVIN